MRIRKKRWVKPELDACPYFIREPEKNRGQWHALFQRERPVYLELGCGKGFFLAGAAPRNPEINYLGIDLKDAVLGPAVRNIDQSFRQAGREPDNILLTALNIERLLSVMNSDDSVRRIYISFCNPWPRKKHQKRRLTHPRQLEQYQRILEPGGEIFFKTDDDELFRDSLEYFKECGFQAVWKTLDLHAEEPAGNVRTEHENMFARQEIKIKAVTVRRLTNG